MDRLYAPWRMAYVDQSAPADPAAGGVACVFCSKASSTDDQADLVITRGKFMFVLMNLYPYSNGHLLIAPYQHTASLSDLEDDALLEMMTLARDARLALLDAYHADGFNIGMNLGTAGGAGIADHLHLHIVPRWNGDTNFMPVIGDVKILPDALQNSAAKIRATWPNHSQPTTQ